MQAVKFATNTLYVKSLINNVYCVCVVLKAGERMLTTKINTQVATISSGSHYDLLQLIFLL